MIYIFSWQAQKSVGTPPTRVMFFVKAHKKKGGTYPNEATREIYVCKMLFCLLFLYLFTIEICLTSLI
jgi:hypothetical protein